MAETARLSAQLVHPFMAHLRAVLKEIGLDTTCDPLRGEQEGRLGLAIETSEAQNAGGPHDPCAASRVPNSWQWAVGAPLRQH